ncbi:MAG: hypothetical protein GTO55_08000 [Armatimonadetes bacterium]|nr:hypothetical protein [Armatimonadota bacterium]NIM24201.1 hypothetical protein [Armatimonadota bacterium]NIM68066.1 hypothetical protein [Armatimonadota bacterium]NIN06275.1 hypothetical protein [Armatimonadota bacterium]NIO97800.1 hypothetical protein [Armatimonadota bacterium]
MIIIRCLECLALIRCSLEGDDLKVKVEQISAEPIVNTITQLYATLASRPGADPSAIGAGLEKASRQFSTPQVAVDTAVAVARKGGLTEDEAQQFIIDLLRALFSSADNEMRLAILTGLADYAFNPASKKME